MTISGRIRSLLQNLDFTGSEQRAFAVLVRKVLGTLEKNWSIFDDPNAEQEPGRWAYQELMQSTSLRLTSERGCEKCRPQRLARRMQPIVRTAEIEIRRAALQPAHLLWAHWLLTFAHHLGGPEPDSQLLHDLWHQSVIFQEKKDAAPFHRLTPDTLLDAFVYDDLLAIHAAYNSAKILNDPVMMEHIQRAVRWHVENTQPDNTTNEPWALAAFAALDDTGTFAEQQLHDAVTHLKNAAPLPDGRIPVAIGLLADAVLTLENA